MSNLFVRMETGFSRGPFIHEGHGISLVRSGVYFCLVFLFASLVCCEPMSCP